MNFENLKKLVQSISEIVSIILFYVLIFLNFLLNSTAMIQMQILNN